MRLASKAKRARVHCGLQAGDPLPIGVERVQPVLRIAIGVLHRLLIGDHRLLAPGPLAAHDGQQPWPIQHGRGCVQAQRPDGAEAVIGPGGLGQLQRRRQREVREQAEPVEIQRAGGGLKPGLRLTHVGTAAQQVARRRLRAARAERWAIGSTTRVSILSTPRPTRSSSVRRAARATASSRETSAASVAASLSSLAASEVEVSP